MKREYKASILRIAESIGAHVVWDAHNVDPNDPLMALLDMMGDSSANDGPYTSLSERTVHLMPSTDPDSMYVTGNSDVDEYWPAIHELGHVATSPVEVPEDDHKVFDYEVQAWQWAVSHADFPVTPCVKALIVLSLVSYQYNNGAPLSVSKIKTRDWLQTYVGPVTLSHHYQYGPKDQTDAFQECWDAMVAK